MSKVYFLVIFYIAGITCAAQSLHHGTTVVTLIFRDSIVIAADTKWSVSNNPEKANYAPKIYESNHFFFSCASAMASYQNAKGDTLFDIDKEFKNIAKRHNDIDQLEHDFIDKLIDKITSQLDLQNYISVAYQSPNDAIDAEILTFKNNRPICRFFKIGFDLKVNPPKMIVTDSSSDVKYKIPFAHKMGIFKDIDNNIDSLLLRKYDLKEKLSELINIEARKWSYNVGGHINVMIIKPSNKYQMY